jgi:hypothetical protein
VKIHFLDVVVKRVASVLFCNWCLFWNHYFAPIRQARDAEILKGARPSMKIFRSRFFSLSEPMCDVGIGKTIRFFYQLAPNLEGFRFFTHTQCEVKKKKITGKPKSKAGCGCFWAHMNAYNEFFENLKSFGSFLNV